MGQFQDRLEAISRLERQGRPAKGGVGYGSSGP